MWVMKASKNFWKITILKIWELISLRGLKTHFGKLALKRCIFRHEKKCFNWYYVVAFDPIKILTLKAPQSDGLNLSFVKDINTVGKKITRNGPTAAIYKFSFISEQSIVTSVCGRFLSLVSLLETDVCIKNHWKHFWLEIQHSI